jgi:hypothetical protein
MKNLILIVAVIFAALGYAGNDHGTGGAVVECTESSGSPIGKGKYSLDYLLTYKNGSSDIVQVLTLEESLDRLQGLFEKKIPEFLETFIEFRKHILNTDYSKKRVWEEVAFGLTPVSTSVFTAEVPKNCQQGNQINTIQTVVRMFPEFSGAPKNRIIYHYIKETYNEVLAASPLQLSFLLVHEWLWDLSLHVERNMKINRFLHSDALEKLSREELIQQLKGMGLVIPTMPPSGFDPNFCRKDKGAGKWWSEHVKKSPLGAVASIGFDFTGRQRKCDTLQGCGTQWTQNSKKWEKLLLPGHRAVKIFPGKFQIFTIDGMSKTQRHAECQFDDDGWVKCRPFVDRQNKQYDFARLLLDNEPGTLMSMNSSSGNLVLTGHIGRDCLALQGDGWVGAVMVGPKESKWYFDAQVALSAVLKPF